MFKTTDYVKFALRTSTPYNMQDEVHRRLGIGLIDFIRLVERNEFRLNGCRDEYFVENKIKYY